MARVMIRSARQDPLFVIQTLPRGVCLPHRTVKLRRGNSKPMENVVSIAYFSRS